MLMADLKELSKVADLSSIASRLNERYGDKSCISGVDAIEDPNRLPTGIFVFDYATGGGFPIYQASIVKGAEHGGKTSLLMSAMSKVSKICWRCFKPKTMCSCSLSSVSMKSVWCDVEGTFNKFWARSIGCSPEDYYLNASESGSEYGDIADFALRADDCGLLVIDSIAALLPPEIMESTMDTKSVGIQAKLITSLVSRINSRLTREYKRGHPCLVIVTNQLRANIGGFSFHGPPTPITPGGHALRHFSGITVNISKKSFADPKAKEKYQDKERNLFLAQKHSFYIEKYKSLKLSEGGEFIRITADIPDTGWSRGDVVDHKLVISELITAGLMTKTNSGYKFGEQKGAQKDFIDMWKSNKDLYFAVQTQLLQHIINNILSKYEIKKEVTTCPEKSAAPAEKKKSSPKET
jgi:recombination protein RecA